MITSPARRRRGAALGVGAALIALTLAGCGGGTSGTTTPGKPGGTASSASIPAESPDAALAAQVPASLKSAGTVKIGTDPTYAPNEFVGADNTTIQGFDVDFGTAVLQKLGLRADFQRASFDAIIPGLSAHKYDLGMSSFTITADREKTLDWVSYYNAGTQMMVKSGNPQHLSVNDDSLCGKRVAAEKGTTQADSDVPARTKKCQGAGKAPIALSVFTDQNGANLALASDKADAVLADSPVAAYAAQQSGGQFQVADQPYGTAPYGIAIPKGQGDLPKALQGAVKAVISDGTYAKILAKWGLTAGGVTDSQVNPAVS